MERPNDKSPLTDQEVDSIFTRMREEDIKKLTDATFTRIQAEALLEMMQKKAFSGGFL